VVAGRLLRGRLGRGDARRARRARRLRARRAVPRPARSVRRAARRRWTGRHPDRGGLIDRSAGSPKTWDAHVTKHHLDV
jgi:hypothetical protein